MTDLAKNAVIFKSCALVDHGREVRDHLQSVVLVLAKSNQFLSVRGAVKQWPNLIPLFGLAVEVFGGMMVRLPSASAFTLFWLSMLAILRKLLSDRRDEM